MGPHRADVKTPKLVVEFQASSISDVEIREREEFYDKMIWVLRGEDFSDNIELRHRGWNKRKWTEPERGDGYRSFRWKHPRKSWWAARRPILIDLGDEMLNVKKIYTHVPCGGWGLLMSKVEFLSRCGSPRDSIAKFVSDAVARRAAAAEEERRRAADEIAEGCAHRNTVPWTGGGTRRQTVGGNVNEPE
jgi:hypothetical protein